MKREFRIQFCIAMFCALFVPFSVLAQSSSEVKIGNQIWMSKNLDVSTFRNGEAIPEAKNWEEWRKAGTNKKAVWCYYENNPKNGKIYGKLYNWFAVNDPRGLAPKGYHIPSEGEWKILTDFLGGEDFVGKKMKSTSGWKFDNDGQYPYNYNGTNSSGFNGLPGGYCSYSQEFNYTSKGTVGTFWSSAEYNSDLAWHLTLLGGQLNVLRNFEDKAGGKSVRCIKD